MKFFSRSNGAPTKDYRVLQQSIDAQIKAVRDYQQHLTSISAQLPQPTREIISAPWYQDFNHHDCPHDSWFLDFNLKVAPKSNSDKSLDSTLDLLGSYHDRILTFTYRNVVWCNFEIQKQGRDATGDWLCDEFDVTDIGLVSHEILWQFGEPWKIIAESVEFSAKDKTD